VRWERQNCAIACEVARSTRSSNSKWGFSEFEFANEIFELKFYETGTIKSEFFHKNSFCDNLLFVGLMGVIPLLGVKQRHITNMSFRFSFPSGSVTSNVIDSTINPIPALSALFISPPRNSIRPSLPSNGNGAEFTTLPSPQRSTPDDKVHEDDEGKEEDEEGKEDEEEEEEEEDGENSREHKEKYNWGGGGPPRGEKKTDARERGHQGFLGTLNDPHGGRSGTSYDETMEWLNDVKRVHGECVDCQVEVGERASEFIFAQRVVTPGFVGVHRAVSAALPRHKIEEIITHCVLVCPKCMRRRHELQIGYKYQRKDRSCHECGTKPPKQKRKKGGRSGGRKKPYDRKDNKSKRKGSSNAAAVDDFRPDLELERLRQRFAQTKKT